MFLHSSTTAMIHTPFLVGSLRKFALGVLCGVALFSTFVLALAIAAHRADQSVIEHAIVAALDAREIQVPGHTDVSDWRGMDTFTDCFMFQSLKLSPQDFPRSMFDTTVYDALGPNIGQRVHTCNTLPHLYKNATANFDTTVTSYYRYWWGSSTIARIVLGYGVSLEHYREAVYYCTCLALAFFSATFLWVFRPLSLLFMPFL